MTENRTTSDYMRDEKSYLAHARALQSAAWPADVPREPIFPLGRKPLTEYLAEWARRQPDKAAVMFYGRAISYAELDRLSNGSPLSSRGWAHARATVLPYSCRTARSSMSASSVS